MQTEKLEKRGDQKEYLISIPTPKTKKDLYKILASSDFDILRESSEFDLNKILRNFGLDPDERLNRQSETDVERRISNLDATINYVEGFSEDFQKRLDNNKTDDREKLTKRKKAFDQYILANKLMFNLKKKQRDKKIEKKQLEQEKTKNIQDKLEQGQTLEKEIKITKDIAKIFTSTDLKALAEMGFDPISGLKHQAKIETEEHILFLKHFKKFQEEKSKEIQNRLDENHETDEWETLTKQKKGWDKSALATQLMINFKLQQRDKKKQREQKKLELSKKSTKKDISEKPIPALRKKFVEKPIPAPRKKFAEKPIPALRKKRDISEKPIPAPKNIMNIKNPEINVPGLKPEIAVVKEKEAPTVIKKTTETVLGWMDWLAESGKKYIVKPVSVALQNLKKKINAIFEKKFEVREGPSALKNFVREKIIEGKPGYDPQSFFEAVRNLVIKILQDNKNTKTKVILICKMQKTDLKTGEIIEVDADFHSEIEINLQETDENNLFDKIIARIGEVLANFQQSGSNWVFQQIIRLEIHFANWQPLGGSTFIPLPAKIKNKGALINLKNEDNQCFKWCVVRALNPVDKNPNRITNELIEQAESLNWSGLKFPMDLKQIKTFEKNNPSISINVFGYEGEVYPLKISKIKKIINIDLLLISDEEKQHYCLIKNLSRLIRSKLTKHHETAEICRSCLNHFPDKKKNIVFKMRR